jgi:hypothetical protein
MRDSVKTLNRRPYICRELGFSKTDAGLNRCLSHSVSSKLQSISCSTLSVTLYSSYSILFLLYTLLTLYSSYSILFLLYTLLTLYSSYSILFLLYDTYHPLCSNAALLYGVFSVQHVLQLCTPCSQSSASIKIFFFPQRLNSCFSLMKPYLLIQDRESVTLYLNCAMLCRMPQIAMLKTQTKTNVCGTTNT